MRHILRDLILFSHLLDLIAGAGRLVLAPFRWVFWLVWGKRPTPPLIEFIELAHKTGGPHSFSCDWFLGHHKDDADLQRRAEAFKKLWFATQRNTT